MSYPAERINSILNVAKFLAIISVILAHCRNTDYFFLSNLTERLGTLGVLTFLIIGGYYFNIEKYGFIPFFKNKLRTIFIPWMFTGTIVYLVGLHFDLIDWLLWIVGYKTYLYYLTIIMSCFLIVSFFNNKKQLYFFIFLTILSISLTSYGYIDLLVFKLSKGTMVFYNYLNVFNWLGFFSIGVLLKKNMSYFLNFLNKNVFYILILYILCLFFSFYIEPESGGYFSKMTLPMEFIGVVSLFSLSTLMVFNRPVFARIAELSFGIYLTHFLIFPIRKYLPVYSFMEFINPLIILTLNSILLLLGLRISKWINLDGLYCTLLGIRNIEKKPNLINT
jgi:hypothetical protein